MGAKTNRWHTGRRGWVVGERGRHGGFFRKGDEFVDVVAFFRLVVAFQIFREAGASKSEIVVTNKARRERRRRGDGGDGGGRDADGERRRHANKAGRQGRPVPATAKHAAQPASQPATAHAGRQSSEHARGLAGWLGSDCGTIRACRLPPQGQMIV